MATTKINLINKLAECNNFAVTKNGLCLSQQYKNNKTPLEWKCNICEHIWYARWNDIKRETSWCPKCSGCIKATIEQCKQTAIKRSGKCLDVNYINSSFLMTWNHTICGHTWKAAWKNINHLNQWCPKCNGNNKPEFNEVIKFICNKNGTLLSNEYINSSTPLNIQCNICNNIWKSRWNDIKRNHWCPSCATLKSERECIKIAEIILNISLVKKRIYLNSENKYQFLEFDGYNEEHKIAIEYNGIQHYEFRPWFHKIQQDFFAQQERDNRKREYCKENTITLIEIPYYEKDIKNFIQTITSTIKEK